MLKRHFDKIQNLYSVRDLVIKIEGEFSKRLEENPIRNKKSRYW